MLNGSIIIGGYTVKYPPLGIIQEIELNDSSNRTVRIHFKCDGPSGDTKPFFLFEGSGSHGLLDYIGIQIELKNLNRSSCIWDKAGLGYSDYLLYNSTLEAYYHNFIKQLNKTLPYIFVGWGGGGETIYEYTLKHPEMVKSLVFLDVAATGVEFELKKKIRNWNETYYNSYRKQDLDGRVGLFRLINGLGVPWGIMSSFMMPSQNTISFPKEYLLEQNWYFLTDKTWITQYYLFNQLYFNPLVDPFNQTINKNISISHIFTAYSNDTIKANCLKENLTIDSQECYYRLEENQYIIDAKINMTKITPGGQVIECTDPTKCNLGTYILDDPKYTAQKLIEIDSIP